MLNWKDLFTNRDRRFFPEVVVPLAHEPTVVSEDALGSNSSLDRGPLQEKGVAGVPTTSKLTLEALRAEVESGVVVSGHDTLYERKILDFHNSDALRLALHWPITKLNLRDN